MGDFQGQTCRLTAEAVVGAPAFVVRFGRTGLFRVAAGLGG